MKLNKLLIVTILSAFVFIIGCKTETAKDLLVRKWKFTEITGPDAAKIPDSVKTKMFATAIMEFKKDGSLINDGNLSPLFL